MAKDVKIITNEPRVGWVDVCRGLAIIAIFIGHITPTDNITNFVYRYHVALFFFLAGFFFSHRSNLNFKKYLLKNISSILLPYAIFCIINIIFFIIVNNITFELIPSYLIQSITGVRNIIIFAPQLWFFTCLFMVSIIYYIMRKFISNNIVLVLTIATLSIGSVAIFDPVATPSLLFNFDSALYYIIFYCVGDLIYPLIIKTKISQLSNIKRRAAYASSALILSSAVLIFCDTNNRLGSVIDRIADIMPGDLSTLLINYLSGLFIAFLLISANINLSFVFKSSRLLANIGRNTLILCGLENIAVQLLYFAFAFLNIIPQTTTTIAKILLTIIKISIIQKILSPIYNKYIYAIIR